MLNKVMIKFKEEQLLDMRRENGFVDRRNMQGIFPISIIKNQEGITGF